MTPSGNDTIERAIRDGDALDGAIAAAHHKVIRLHRALELPLAIWRDGKVVQVSADRISLSARAGRKYRHGV
jgi:hypothetical protein